MEEWKQHPKYNHIAISSFGNVYNLDSDRPLKTRQNKDIYLVFSVYDKDTKQSIPQYVAKYVASLFIRPLKKGEYVNYKDGNLANCRVDNLFISDFRSRYKSRKDCSYKRNGRKPKKIKCNETGEIFNSAAEISSILDVSKQSIYDSINRKKKVLILGMSFSYVRKIYCPKLNSSFDSIEEAAKITDIDKDIILEILEGKRNSYDGFIFKDID